jgi:hypothetical protein
LNGRHLPLYRLQPGLIRRLLRGGAKICPQG